MAWPACDDVGELAAAARHEDVRSVARVERGLQLAVHLFVLDRLHLDGDARVGLLERRGGVFPVRLAGAGGGVVPERHRDVAVGAAVSAAAAGAGAQHERSHDQDGRPRQDLLAIHVISVLFFESHLARGGGVRIRTLGESRDRCACASGRRHPGLAFSVAMLDRDCQTFSKTFSIRYDRHHGTPRHDQRCRRSGRRLGLDGLESGPRQVRRFARHDAPRARCRRAARLPVQPRCEQHALAPHGRDRRARAGLRALQRRDPQGRGRRPCAAPDSTCWPTADRRTAQARDGSAGRSAG